MKKWAFWFVLLVAIGGVAGAGYWMGWEKVHATVLELSKTVRGASKSESVAKEDSAALGPKAPWKGTVELTQDQLGTIGVTFAKVEPQSEPTYLDVNGTTAYNPNTLTPIRSRFQCLVSKVYVHVGNVVHKDDPIVDLYSTDLAQAKSAYEIGLAQWNRDAAQLERVKPLFKNKAISEKEYYDAVNDEQKSRLTYKVARDNLVVYGLSDEEINAVEKEEGSAKARMTLHSPTNGIVIVRDVVEGSLYDTTNVLVTIAPQDKLWVLGNVYESDQEKVHVGQSWEVRFPFLADVLETKIEHMDMRVNPTTKTIQIRTSIDNPNGRFKADMLVRGKVAIPPVEGHLVIPRQAVVVQDTKAHVFVRGPGNSNKFVRKEITLVQEAHDHVIVSSGLEAGQEVVVRGSLILSQIYEDESTAETGMPL